MQLGIRAKLISIFIIIKVIPLVLLAWFAMEEISNIGTTVEKQSLQTTEDTREIIHTIGDLAAENSISALDEKSRENIERLTTDTALTVASFLYERDKDILTAATIVPSLNNYKDFLALRVKPIIYHEPWHLSEDGSQWIAPKSQNNLPSVSARLEDNKKDFHYRHPEQGRTTRGQPLFLEITLIGTDGMEKMKVTSSDLLPKKLLDVSRKENTWCKAESYFNELTKLAPGEIYVSEVIGPYLPSPLIGPYTKQRSMEKGIPFEPEEAAYAGKENPVGKRFQGLIRWATPMVENGQITGYVTLALDHTHIMEFTDHLIPTEERYSAISDASSGNYAFMWDSQGRNISHPRDYFIVGYNPDTGKPAVPWLSSELYDSWQKSGISYEQFQKTAPRFQEQSLEKKPAAPLTRLGMLALDCRYLNFAPQCNGWHNLTQYGGSGSFVIYWSKLWKLTTAATIPYYTGMYKNSPRGFGYVTIGANVREFHRAATETADQIGALKNEYETRLEVKNQQTQELTKNSLAATVKKLSMYTLVMIVLVILIAFWMASVLTGKITSIIQGIKRFQEGDLTYRLGEESHDEMGQLSRAFNNMSDKIKHSIEEIRLARDKAQKSDQAKSTFLANMSHEIRTPLNGISGFTDLLLNSEINKIQKTYLQNVRISSDRLIAVINDILDFSKIEAGRLDILSVPFNLPETLDRVLQILSTRASEKDLKLRCTVDPQIPEKIIGDPDRLMQIIINLVSNGIKFTDHGSITMQVSMKESQKNDKILLKFSITDTGIGIPKDKQKLIFKAFTQADSSHARKFGGTGLGLSISCKMASLMGGNIGMVSKEGHGSTFWFTACFEIADENNTTQPSLAPNVATATLNTISPITILLVEDETINAMMAQIMLEELGLTVITVENGKEAVSSFENEAFDIILMDIQMPEMDGIEATRKIREIEESSGGHIPIIALTAHAMKGYKEECQRAGMDDYIIKPIQQNDLVAAIRKQMTDKPPYPTDGYNKR
jgi:signal transduction histidine kinase/ActR/RegA family two-component response regulator